MQILDLTNRFINDVLIKNDPDKYISSFPELFNHYFQYWCFNKQFDFNISSTKIKSQTDKIINKLPSIEQSFLNIGIDEKTIEVVLFVGNNTSNGHAFKFEDKFIVWLPVETYSSPKLIEVFIPHEIAHAIHYSFVTEFYFTTKIEQYNMFRQLITEGIATFVSMKIAGVDKKTALWADYLPQSGIDKWYLHCENNKTELAKYALVNFDKSLNPNLFFTINNAEFGNRKGYYLGLKIAEFLFELCNFSVKNLLKLELKTAKQLSKQYLKKLISP